MADVDYEEFISTYSRPGCNDIHRCKKCPYFSKSIFSVKNHVRRHSSSLEKFSCGKSQLETFYCRSCNYKTEVIMQLRTHMQDQHALSVENNDVVHLYVVDNYVCKHCLFQSHSILHWLSHLRGNKYNDLYCGSNEKAKVCQIPRELICDQCPYKTLKPKYLRKHQRNIHTSDDKIDWFKCNKCSYKSKYRNVLKTHKINKHPSKTEIYFECDQCSYKSKHRRNIRNHKRLNHTPDDEVKWFECSQCSFKTKRSNHLTRHITDMHTPDDEINWFSCDHCSYKCKQKYRLTAHINSLHNSKHNKIRWFRCGECSYKAKNRAALKDHVKRKHGCSEDETNLFKCDQCSFTAKTKSDLNRHLRKKHETEVLIS